MRNTQTQRVNPSDIYKAECLYSTFYNTGLKHAYGVFTDILIISVKAVASANFQCLISQTKAILIASITGDVGQLKPKQRVETIYVTPPDVQLSFYPYCSAHQKLILCIRCTYKQHDFHRILHQQPSGFDRSDRASRSLVLNLKSHSYIH